MLKENLDEAGCRVQGVQVADNVNGSRRGGRKNPKALAYNKTDKTINVKKGGKVILSCGALPTNRILYRSLIHISEPTRILSTSYAGFFFTKELDD